MRIRNSIKPRWWSLLLLGILVTFQHPGSVTAQGVQNTSLRPFVMGFTPVIGRNGFVGGVSVDAEGVVSRATADDTGNLRELWLKARAAVPKDVTSASQLRMLSLAGLDKALVDLVNQGKSAPEEVFFLAGLQRVQFIFVFPDEQDVVLAGPAEGWQMNSLGDIVGVTTGRPTLRLDDLLDAFRSAETARTEGVSCSIEPTVAGLQRYQRLLASRNRPWDQTTVRALERALGPQQVIVSGVPGDGHFANVMVAADYVMKRLAMGFEDAPVDNMPSYMEMLRSASAGTQVTSLRWWLTANYEPLLRSADGLAWQICGPGVKTLTEDSFLTASGAKPNAGRANPRAQRWADTMTEKYEELSAAIPVFGKLRNCMDLAIVAALISKEDLLNAARCDLDILFAESRLRGPQYYVPKTVDSRATFVRGRGGWIISVSGGVKLDSWSAVDRIELSDTLSVTSARANRGGKRNWWWDA